MPNRLAFAATPFTVGMAFVTACSDHSPRSPNDSGPSDAPVVNDAAEGGSEGDDAGDANEAGCAPMSVSAFQPPAFVPSHRSLACNGFNGDGGLVQSYGDACFGNQNSYDRCHGFVAPSDPAGQACFRCVVSTESPDASEYGAVVIATVPLVNYAGCVGAIDTSEAGASCAQAITSAGLCAEYACKTVCPVADQTSQDAYNACWNQATAGECVGYWQASESCIAQEWGDGGTEVYRVCFDGNRPTSGDYLSLAHYFCGAD